MAFRGEHDCERERGTSDERHETPVPVRTAPRTKGPDAGTVEFSVNPDSSGEFTALLVSLQDTGVTKVGFAERLVPSARIVSRTD
jgi:hypothetical protein